MVKIKIKLFVLSFIAIILMTGIAFAQSNLIFSDVDVKVGSKTSNNLQDGESIDDEAEPGDIVEVRVEVSNNFSSDGPDIEDITIQATIEEIDDGDDLDEESTEFDLSPGRDKRVTLRFEVPVEVDEDDFDITIEAEGEDENGTQHRAQMTITLEVNKENHLISITRYSITPNTLQCGKRNVQVSVGLVNLGTEDEDDVSLRIFNTQLGIDKIEDIGELTSEPNEEESRFSGTFSFNIPQNVEYDSYPITIRALYDNERRKTEKTLTLAINECPISTGNTGNTGTTGATGTTGGVVVITPPPQQPAIPTQTPEEEIEVPEGTVVTSEGYAQTNAFLVGIIIAEVVAVIIGIVLLVTLFRKKE